MQTFQPANLGISKSTGNKPWRLYLKPGDVFIFLEQCLHNELLLHVSLVPGLQFSCPSGKECSLKTVLRVCVS